jgi:hypothetical protein
MVVGTFFSRVSQKNAAGIEIKMHGLNRPWKDNKEGDLKNVNSNQTTKKRR